MIFFLDNFDVVNFLHRLCVNPFVSARYYYYYYYYTSVSDSIFHVIL